MAFDIAKNVETYMNFRMAHHITCQLSTRSKLFISSYVILESHTEKPSVLFFYKGASNSTPQLSDTDHSYRHRRTTDACLP